MKTFVFDPSFIDKGSRLRGGGRFIQLLKENLIEDVEFIRSLKAVSKEDTLVIPFFNPFSRPPLFNRIAKKQILVIYDVIPLKYASHFPVGMKGSFFLTLHKLALQNYDTIVTISKHSKEDISKTLSINENKIQIVYPILAQSFLNESKGNIKPYNLPKKYLLYVADVNWNKNIATMAKAVIKAGVPLVCVGKVFEKLNNNIEKMKLLQSLSHPWLSEFKSFVEETYNNPLFIFPGYVPDDDLELLYQNSIANVLLSRDEGYGFSYLEAASQKTPSLLSDTPIFKEIALDTALFAKPDSVTDIVKKIKELEAVRDEMGKKAYERSLFFSPQTFRKRWKEVID